LIVRAAIAKETILFTILIGLVLLATIIEGAYFFRVVQVIYFKNGTETEKPIKKEAPVTALVPMFVFVTLIVVLGVYPELVTDILNAAASELLNRMEYIRSILG